MYHGCAPGCPSVVDGVRCGFRTGRDCPPPYTAAAVQLSAAEWDPSNRTFAMALALSERRVRADCHKAVAAAHVQGQRGRAHSPPQSRRSGGWCIQQLPEPPETFSITSADGVRHDYRLSDTRHVEHGAAWGGVTRVLHDVLRPQDGRRSSYRSLLDLGAGLGQYGRALHALDPRHRYAGYDGAGNVANVTGGFVRFADMTLPLSLPPAHWVLSLDSGEHVPRAHEMMFVRNLHAHACVGVLLSWADLEQGGVGHVNCHSPQYLWERFEALGYVLDERLTRRLRNQSFADAGDGDVSKFLAMRRRTPRQSCGEAEA